MNIRNIVLALLAWLPLMASAEVTVGSRATAGSFCLAAGGHAATIYVDNGEALVVKKAASLLSDDVFRVTSLRPALLMGRIASEKQTAGNNTNERSIVIIGTVSNSRIIRDLAKAGRLDVSGLFGGWEQYVITTVDRPMKGIAKALVIVGSDKRGAAYGALTLSERMGVSPFYWWSDIPVRRQPCVYVSGSETSRRPTIKYRGLFINDEDWGFKPWASKNYEKDLGEPGPRTYARVCELILRLKGNMLAPAMHACTAPFYSIAGSKVVADSFGIMITTSHCEPLLINTASKWEWDVKRDGEWNYATNAKAIKGKWTDRLRAAGQYDNIYTLAMRGLHDAGLRGNLPMEERVPLLEQVISDQQKLLTRYVNKDLSKVPQIFVPYKETMDVYEHGLRVPDDVTLVWVDDNYGYMKRVSNPAEQQRKGGAGVYYHISYLGAPHDYLWLNTTPPVLMYEELRRAYDAGADRYWLLNVGDIKPGELGIKTFMSMAWDLDRYTIGNVNEDQSRFLASLFGSSYAPMFQHVLDEYYRLAWSRKPEFMGWEREWDSKEYTGLKDTEFSFTNYGEAQRRLKDYADLGAQVDALLRLMPDSLRPVFFELLEYPVKAAEQMNRKFLMAQLNHELSARQQTAQANWAAQQSKTAYDSINALNNHWDTLLNGKWKHMMALAPGWCALYGQMPQVTTVEDVEPEAMDLTPRCGRATEGTHVVDLASYVQKVQDAGHRIDLIRGIGYDGEVVRLGQTTDTPGDATQLTGDRVVYELPQIAADSVTVHVFSVPVFPLYQGRGNQIGVSVDGCAPLVFNNLFTEYSLPWKNQVLRNGAEGVLRFAIDRNKTRHTLSFIVGEPGEMIEKVIVDWGGLKPSYIGPTK